MHDVHAKRRAEGIRCSHGGLAVAGECGVRHKYYYGSRICGINLTHSTIPAHAASAALSPLPCCFQRCEVIRSSNEVPSLPSALPFCPVPSHLAQERRPSTLRNYSHTPRTSTPRARPLARTLPLPPPATQPGRCAVRYTAAVEIQRRQTAVASLRLEQVLHCELALHLDVALALDVAFAFTR